MPNVLRPRDLVSRPDNMDEDETVLHTSMVVQLGLCWTWLETQKTGFLMVQLIIIERRNDSSSVFCSLESIEHTCTCNC